MLASKVTITRQSNQKGTGKICIRIEDAASGLRIIEVKMSLGEFAECLTGMAACPAETQFAPTVFVVENIGKKRETKIVNIDWHKDNGDSKDFVAKVEPHLVNGWKLNNNSLGRQQHGTGHNISLYRFVGQEAELKGVRNVCFTN